LFRGTHMDADVWRWIALIVTIVAATWRLSSMLAGIRTELEVHRAQIDGRLNAHEEKLTDHSSRLGRFESG